MEAVDGDTSTSQTLMPSGTIAEASAEVGTTGSEEEEEASGWRQKKTEGFLKARVQMKTTGAQLMSVSKEEVTPEPERRSGLDQNDPPAMPTIKEEQEELWSSQEGEQLQGLEEAEVQFKPFTVQSEERDEEKPQPSQLDHTEDMKTEVEGKDCGGPEPENNVNTGSYLKPLSDDEMSHSSEPETDDSCDWEESRGAQSGLNPLRNIDEPEVDQFPVCEPAAGGAAELPEEEERHKYEQRPQLMSVSKEDVPPGQKELRFSLDQIDPPELPTVKKEQEELWSSREGEQLQGLEEADVKFTPTPVSVKSEEMDEEELQSSQPDRTEDMKTEGDGEDCGGLEPGKSINTEGSLKPLAENETPLSSEPETDDSCDWEETTGAQSGINAVRNNGQLERNTGITAGSSSECTSSFDHKKNLQEDGGLKIGGKQFICSVCGKKYTLKTSLTAHMRLHSEEKRFSCSVCKKNFIFRANLLIHMRVHTGEKPFGCTVCSSRFTQKQCLRDHMRIHSGEKPFSCSVCGRRFIQCANLLTHLRIHTGEKPFSCTVCSKTFSHQGSLRTHMRTHTGEKPFSCSVCERSFTQLINLKKHKCPGESSGSKGSCSNAS